MVSIQHKIRWTFHIGSYHRIMKDVSYRLHRTKMKLRAYYITLHLQHKILTHFCYCCILLLLLMSDDVYIEEVWFLNYCYFCYVLIYVIFYKVYSCTIIILCYTSWNTADDETTMLVSLRSRIKTTCTNVWSCVLPLHILVYCLDKKLLKRSALSLWMNNICVHHRFSKIEY